MPNNGEICDITYKGSGKWVIIYGARWNGYEFVANNGHYKLQDIGDWRPTTCLDPNGKFRENVLA